MTNNEDNSFWEFVAMLVVITILTITTATKNYYTDKNNSITELLAAGYSSKEVSKVLGD